MRPDFDYWAWLYGERDRSFPVRPYGELRGVPARLGVVGRLWVVALLVFAADWYLLGQLATSTPLF